MQQYIKSVIIFLFSCFILFLSNSMVYAVASAIKIVPSRFEILVKSRERSIQSINFSNGGRTPLKINATTQDWDISEEGSIVLLDAGSSSSSASNWLRFNPRRFVVPAGETQVIRFAVTVPPGIEPGEYRTTIVLTTQEKYEIGNNFIYEPVFAILVYVNIPQINRIGEIDDVLVQVDKDGNYIIEGTLTSRGNAHIRAEGEFRLLDSDGLIIEQKKLGKEVVLPERRKKFQINLSKTSGKGKYTGQIYWRYLPAFYMEGEMDEYFAENGELLKELELFIE